MYTMYVLNKSSLSECPHTCAYTLPCFRDLTVFHLHASDKESKFLPLPILLHALHLLGNTLRPRMKLVYSKNEAWMRRR
jgi:hypothetical protein